MAREISIEDILGKKSITSQNVDNTPVEDNFLLGKKAKKVRKPKIDLDAIPDLEPQKQEISPVADNVVHQVFVVNKVAPDDTNTGVEFKNIEQDIELPKGLQDEVDTKQQIKITPVEPQKIIVPQVNNGIVIPTSMAVAQQEAFVNDIRKKKDRKQKFQVVTQKTDVIPEQHEDAVQAITDAYEEITGNEIPEKVDMVEIRDAVIDAVSEIPDAEGVDLTNIELKVTKKDKESKAGYYKVKVNIKKSGIPNIINKIAGYVKSETKGLISPRVCDLRVIGNTNKTQLRGSTLKLSVNTVVFKPDSKKLKVNKGTRIMISIPDDFNSTGNLLIYIQESRAKSIHEIKKSDFDTENKFINFIAERIVEYYVVGYQATIARITLHATNNPLTEIMTKILKSGQYKGQPLFDESNMYGFDIATKSDLNQWLVVRVSESSVVPNKYDISAFNTVNGDEYDLIQRPLTYQELDRTGMKLIDAAFAKDWSDVITDADDVEYNEFMYNLQKLKHFKLRKAAIEIWDARESNTEISIIRTLSKNDMNKLMVTDYDSEAILGKTSNVEWVLTYLAYPIIGGDARYGADYITRQQYYQKYDVKDRNEYQARKNTVLVKEGLPRNYNARIYLFQLEYKIDGESNVYRARTFKEIKDDTGFLTNNLKFPKSKY